MATDEGGLRDSTPSQASLRSRNFFTTGVRLDMRTNKPTFIFSKKKRLSKPYHLKIVPIFPRPCWNRSRRYFPDKVTLLTLKKKEKMWKDHNKAGGVAFAFLLVQVCAFDVMTPHVKIFPAYLYLSNYLNRLQHSTSSDSNMKKWNSRILLIRSFVKFAVWIHCC